jgi:hypothetical protein
MTTHQAAHVAALELLRANVRMDEFSDPRTKIKLAAIDAAIAALTASPQAAPEGGDSWAADDFYSDHPLPALHDDPAINAEILIQALTARLDTARKALAAAAAMQVVEPKLQRIKANAAWAMDETSPRRLLPRSVTYNAASPQVQGGEAPKRATFACRECGHVGDDFTDRHYRAGDADVECPKCGSTEADEADASTPQRAPGVDEAVANLKWLTKHYTEVVPVGRLRNYIDKLEAALASGPSGVDGIAKDVHRVIAEGDGYWTPCSGCHETVDGYETGGYPWSDIFRCHLGGGCSECGGLGAVWFDLSGFEPRAPAAQDQGEGNGT